MGHFLDVCAYFFAKIGDHVGVTDFQREERIGGVLDELGAVDGGDEEFGFAARRAGSVVHRAAETFFENRAVDFEKSLDRKSTRLNSSHRCISYAVFCLKKKKKKYKKKYKFTTLKINNE